MPLLSTKFSTLLLVGSIALLTACNQSAKVAAPSISVTSITSHNPDIHSIGQPADSTMTMPSNSTTSQPAYIAEYKQAMSLMHDQMMTASNITNPDVAFATGMIAHHQGAIAMAKIQLKYGKDQQIRSLAKNIINTQQAEIIQMQTWLDNHKNDTTKMVKNMPTMPMTGHTAMMQGIMSHNPDVAFVKGMIPHHQGAIDMANTELKMGNDTSMRALAKQIQSTQGAEIQQMQAWLGHTTMP